MSRGDSLFNHRSRRGPSLRLYFDDMSIESDYLSRIKKQFGKAAERRLLIPDNMDLYTEIPRRENLATMPLNKLPIDQVDTGETQALIDNCDRNKPTPELTRNFPKTLRRRRAPKMSFYNIITDPLGSDDTRHLIDAIERNNIQAVESMLKKGVSPHLMYTLTRREAEDLRLTIGTLQPEERASWTVLHEASSRAHWHCVRLLLEAGVDPNTTGVKGLTALDVAGSSYHYNHHKIKDSLTKVIKMLLEKGGKFNTMKGRDDNFDTPLHTAAEIKSVESIELLLDAGASVSCLNTDGLTPLHICLQTKSAEVLDVLINFNRKNVLQLLERVDVTDSCGFTILQAAVILNWMSGLRIVLEAGAQLTYSAKHSKISLWQSPKWYQLLQSRQTPIHLAVACNNIEIINLMLSKILEIDAIDCLNQDGETPLFTAIKQGHFECVKMLIFEGASITEVSIKDHTALHVAAEYDQTEILKFLMEYDDETKHIINKFNKQGCAPLHCAAMNNNPECVKILLQNQADIRLKTFGYNSLSSLHIAAGYNYTNVANVILQHDKTTIDEVDNRGYSPLHAAAHNCCHDVMLLLLRNGATLSSCTMGSVKESKTAIEMITNKLPNPTLFFQEVFDSCINSQDAFGMTKVNVNYQVLGKINEIHQMKVIEELVRCGQQKILIHPLLDSLLFLKWQTLLPFFYVILATYAFFVFSLNVLVVSQFYYCDKMQNVPLFFQKVPWLIIVYISICLLLIQEFFYINIRRTRYFFYFETWVKLSSIGLAATLGASICHSSCSESEWPRHIATVALLLSWVEIMFLLSRFPSWGYYVLMFGNVSVTIIKILLTFIFLVIAFSFSFMIQFKSTAPFDDLWASLIKTMVMMTSEFDYVSLFNEANFEALSSSRTIVRLLFLVFLLFVSIVFMNFMVGVAVSDINNLNIQGNTKRMGKLVEVLSTLDVVVHDGPLSKVLPRKTFEAIKKKRFVRNISTFPGSEKTWSIACGEKINKHDFETDCKINLPKSLGNAIMNKAKEQKQQTEDECVHKAYMDKIDLLLEGVTREEQPVTRNVLESNMNDLNAKVETMFSEIAEMKLLQEEMLKHMEEILLKSY